MCDSNTDLTRAPGCAADDRELYIDEIREPLTATEELLEQLLVLKDNLREIHELLTEIDCDYGAANAEVKETTLTVTAHAAEIKGPMDSLVSDYEWDDHDISYDANDCELYTAQLSLDVPSLVLMSFSSDGEPTIDVEQQQPA